MPDSLRVAAEERRNAWVCERCGRVSAHREETTFRLWHSEYEGGGTGSTFVINLASIKAWTTEHCYYSDEPPPCPWVRMSLVPDPLGEHAN